MSGDGNCCSNSAYMIFQALFSAGNCLMWMFWTDCSIVAKGRIYRNRLDGGEMGRGWGR